MLNEGYFIYNGKFISNKESVITPDNRAFRYGDGFFETMLCIRGKLYFWDYHKDRINDSINKLRIDKGSSFSLDELPFFINKLIHKNKIKETARIRINFFRGDEDLLAIVDIQANLLNYIIQIWPIESGFHLYKEVGLSIGIFPDGRKACDTFSNIKSNNYLTYTMAAIWAKEKQLNDAIVLNQYNRIADTTIANIFIVNSENNIITPKLSEGCINGIMRRHIIEASSSNIQETEITQKDIMDAKEIFLTNAIRGISWVENIASRKLTHKVSKAVYMQLNLLQYI